MTFVAGLPSDSAFAVAIQQDREDDQEWRKALGAVTGRDYTRPSRRIPLEQFTGA